MYKILEFIKNIYYSRRMLLELARNDLRERYSGSLLGLAWSVLQPLFTICVMWFVFSFGFRAVPVDDVPFILWLSAGMVPWFFLSDAFISMGNCIVEKSFLVKKVVFNIALLPVIKVISLLFVHLFFIFVLVFMFCLYGMYPSLMYGQLLYYLLAAVCLVVSLSYITASVVVFSKDFGQLIGIAVQFLFWATPTFWNLTLIPEAYRWIFKLNPCWYIINGYRDTFIYGRYFWQAPLEAAVFWGTALITGIAGIILFNKLRPHFADVL